MIRGRLGSDTDREVRRPTRSRRPLDRIDKAIVVALQRDGRTPSAELAAALGVAEAVVEQRIAHLTETGVIHVVAVTDPLQLGFARQALIGITVDGPAKPVAEELALIEEVDYVVTTAGGFDILAELLGKSDAHLLELVSGRIRPIPGVASIQPFLYLELEKQSYAWGVND